MKRQNRFITFEGGEGAGKSTQVHLLAERLERTGASVVTTREPGGSPYAETLRTLLLDPKTPPHGPLSEALLFYAARADHLAHTIHPALSAGKWVLCDRFIDSTRAYQSFAGTLPGMVCDRLDEVVVEDAMPFITFILDIDAESGLQRAHARRNENQSDAVNGDRPIDRYEGRDIEFHRRLREGFLSIANANPERCCVVDATLPADDLANEVWSTLKTRCPGEFG